MMTLKMMTTRKTPKSLKMSPEIMHQRAWAELMLPRRVCPQPKPWNEVFRRLPGKTRQGTGWEPPLPLILAAWWEATDSQKRERLRLHLEWAENHGVLPEIFEYLKTLKPEDWHTEDN